MDKPMDKINILVLDDDEVNLMILNKGVKEAGYSPVSFLESPEAWDYLQKNAGEIDIALIDKMMPDIDGLELLRRMKSHPDMQHIPVIIQTGDVGVEQMREGLEGGAFYYLTKPYHPEILIAILHSAVNDRISRQALQSTSETAVSNLLPLTKSATYHVYTLEDARLIVSMLAERATYPEFAAVGLMELMNNAIEHGNLEIGYDTKREWLLAGNWQEKLASRMKDPIYADRKIEVMIDRQGDRYELAITDDGKGFDWHHHLYDSQAQLRLNEPNGRGIAKAGVMLDNLKYSGSGNHVTCSIKTGEKQMDVPVFELSSEDDIISHKAQDNF